MLLVSAISDLHAAWFIFVLNELLNAYCFIQAAAKLFVSLIFMYFPGISNSINNNSSLVELEKHQKYCTKYSSLQLCALFCCYSNIFQVYMDGTNAVFYCRNAPLRNAYLQSAGKIYESQRNNNSQQLKQQVLNNFYGTKPSAKGLFIFCICIRPSPLHESSSDHKFNLWQHISRYVFKE